MLLLSLLACDWGTSPETPPTPPTPTPPPAETEPLPEPRIGVSEVVTPPEILRPTEVQDRAGQVLLDVRFDADHATFDGLGRTLERWGFALLDGDGAVWRVSPPPGRFWAERLEPLPEVADVREALDREPMETGTFREGSERYGDAVHTWAWREGGPEEAVSGGATPPAPALPAALPEGIARCLAPLSESLEMGVSVGPGWERALRTNPPAWALVLEDYGFCRARGWVLLRPDAPVDTLTAGGRPVDELDAAALQALAIDALQVPRADEDETARAAVEELRAAPLDVRMAATRAAAPGPARESLLEAWHRQDPAGALAFATQNADPSPRALAASEDSAVRADVLKDEEAPADAVLAALGAWRPTPGDEPPFLARLREHPDPRVRERAWERTLDARAAECDRLALAKVSGDAAENAWRACPRADVRTTALAGVSPDRQAALLDAALHAPETVPAGVAAARQAAALRRHDLLAAVVPSTTVPRDVRLVALRALVDARSPGADALAEVHGAFLGYKPLQVPTSAEVEP